MLLNAYQYQVTVPNKGDNDTTTFWLTHVYGSAYEMGTSSLMIYNNQRCPLFTHYFLPGYAQGSLLKEHIKDFITSVWEFMEDELERALPNTIPKWLSRLIADFGLKLALDLTEMASKDFTPQYFYDELKGLSDASGVDYQTLVRVHMIAGLTQG